PGIHGAVGWLLRRWGRGQQVDEMDRARATGKPDGDRRWYVNARGETMIVLPPGEFRRGLVKGRFGGRVDYRLSLAAREVTVADFRRFRRGFVPKNNFATSEDCPISEMTWYDAAAYCNWLSEQDGIPQSQWCYSPNEQGKYAQGMTVFPDFLRRS